MKTYKMKINNEFFEAKIKENNGKNVVLEVNGTEYTIELEKPEKPEKQQNRSAETKPKVIQTHTRQSSSPKTHSVNSGAVLAPIPGLVLRILVKEGDQVKLGDTILVLEAMKMESEITSTAHGVVKKIKVTEGQSVQEDEVLIEVGE